MDEEELIPIDYDYSSHEPNEETIEAIEEARSGKHAGTIDMSSFAAFMKSCETML